MSTERAATVTPGQAAYEAFYTAFGGGVPDWPPIGMEGGREAWDAAAQAVAPALAGLLATARQLRDEAIDERDAALALAAEILGAFSTVSGDWYLAGVSREQHDEWRKRTGLVHS